MSEVWQVFIKTDCGLRAQCQICKKTYANSGTNTTNLWNHLQSKHKSKFKELDDQRKGFSGSPSPSSLLVNIDECDDEGSFSSTATTIPCSVNSTSSKMKNEKKMNQLPITSYTLTATAQARIDNVLAYFISTDMMPYSIVSKDGFKMYTNALNASYKIPSRKTMTESRIPYLYKVTKENVETIAKNTLFMSFTTDCWTSVANQPFMALTGCICLGCIELIEDHTGDNIADALIMLFLEYNIEIPSNKICSFTTDHGSNVLKAVKNLNITHTPCFGHAFNIAVGRIFLLQQVNVIVVKVKKIQNIFAHSWQAVKHLKTEQERFGLKCIKIPSYSKTRWWSLLDLIKVVITQELALSSFLRTYKKGEYKKCIIDVEEFEVLKCIEMVLSPVREIADNLAGETYVTASAIYPVINNIKNKINEVSTNENTAELKTEMYNTISDLLDNRYNDNNALKITMVLDPRFKMKYINDTDQISVKYAMKTECLSAWLVWNEMHNGKEDGTDNLSMDNYSSPSKKVKQSGLLAIFGEPNVPNNRSLNQEDDTTPHKIEKEIEFYTGLPTISFCQNPLKWWNLNSSMYPFLTILARKFLTIQATSVASERVFSKGGLIVTDHRATLTNDHASQLVFLSANKAHVPIPV
ncbi:unnamed protein product [Macrosiphum euphorbiae]|uniref:BED-type domain-containing protein n=1 Tax=Macrosiphum euphorbiae TaxID=13131 RepID=A0AAV0WRL4_9HEMI|nr:unnamed protein product [Macrosiphum euphorbiae]